MLFHQAARDHYVFVIDPAQHIRGFLGWTLAPEAFAQAWAAGGAGLVNDAGDGDCVIVNAWAAEDGAANRFLRIAATRLFASARAVYFKRHYADGRERPMRLAVPEHRRPKITTPRRAD